MKALFLLLILLGGLTAMLLAAPAPQSDFVVVVNRSNDTESMRPTDLERIYRGRQERWQDGQKIVAINRPVGADIRRHFYERIFRGPPSLKFFKPNSPIPFKTMVVQSDAAVARFVAHIPNAIGYVSRDFQSDAVRFVDLED